MKHPFYTLSDLKRLLIPAFLFLVNIQLMQAQSTTLFTINQTNVSVKEVLTQLEKSSKYAFLYADKDVDANRKVSVRATNQPLNVVLDQLFQNTNNSYTIDGSQVFITRKVVQSTPGKVQKKSQITGYVLDSKKISIIGASVMLLGSTQGTVTDFDGKFTLEVPENSQLKISFVGYEPQLVNVGDKTSFSIVMRESENKLEEIIISAQAIGQKNAILQQINSNTIKNVVAADRLQENPDANAVEAIGRLPGISVVRSGGEGSSLVLRGLEPKYASVTLNGVQMPSTGNARETNISGVSQYMLQGVEVTKSLTPDMEANSVAGTINMKLRESPDGFRTNIMLQGGHNPMNNYFGNYKFQADVSNRFLDNKLGAFLSVGAERVNRSTQTMSAGYDNGSSDEQDVLMNSINLNIINSLRYRRSAMLSLDYKLTPKTTLALYGMYTNSQNDYEHQAKGFNISGNGGLGVSMHKNPYNVTNIIQSALSGVSKLDFLKMELDYGVAYSNTINNNPDSRSWSFTYYPAPTDSIFDFKTRRLHPETVIPYFNTTASDSTLLLDQFNRSVGKSNEDNLTGYFNAKIPFIISDNLNGFIKFGGTYRNKKRVQNIDAGYMLASTNQFAPYLLKDALPWLAINKRPGITANNFGLGTMNNFLNGQYDFGNVYDFEKLNALTDTWINISDYYYNQGEEVWRPIFGDRGKIGFTQDILPSLLNDQDIIEDYYAGYFMTQLNLGNWLMFMPGFRYEKTTASMKGFETVQPTLPDPMYASLQGSATEATRSDDYFLPMIHLRIRPADSYYVHLAYTHTLSRPDFNTISPNSWINTGFQPFAYVTQAPDILNEKWTNYDAQVTYYTPKVGLISLSAFYKTVENKIWQRSFKRLKGDPVIEPFPDNAMVNVTRPENHNYPINLKGLEFEMQTSFWYLPKPFKYLTVNANFTVNQSSTSYPLSWVENKVPPGGGRPVPVRIDTIVSGTMLFQPKYLANFSLGYNREGLNVWLSYQYNGEILTGSEGIIRNTPWMTPIKEYFNRWDLQITQKFYGKLKGMEVVANLANLSDFTETSRLKGDPRPNYIEKYGWTIDLGLRYSFSTR